MKHNDRQKMKLKCQNEEDMSSYIPTQFYRNPQFLKTDGVQLKLEILSCT